MKSQKFLPWLMTSLLLMGGTEVLFSQTDFWQSTNGPTGGWVTVLVVHPATQDVFAGTISGGVYRSTDNGNSWTAVNNGVTNFNVGAFAINSSGHIFASTFGGGVFRSMDNGESWAAVNTGLTNLTVDALAINSSGHVFAGIASGGVYRTTNNGESWTPSLPV
jgi:photosystem II stability/assembly factor-like uncharacterized protein